MGRGSVVLFLFGFGLLPLPWIPAYGPPTGTPLAKTGNLSKALRFEFQACDTFKIRMQFAALGIGAAQNGQGANHGPGICASQAITARAPLLWARATLQGPSGYGTSKEARAHRIAAWPCGAAREKRKKPSKKEKNLSCTPATA